MRRILESAQKFPASFPLNFKKSQPQLKSHFLIKNTECIHILLPEEALRAEAGQLCWDERGQEQGRLVRRQRQRAKPVKAQQGHRLRPVLQDRTHPPGGPGLGDHEVLQRNMPR